MLSKKLYFKTFLEFIQQKVYMFDTDHPWYHKPGIINQTLSSVIAVILKKHEECRNDPDLTCK